MDSLTGFIIEIETAREAMNKAINQAGADDPVLDELVRRVREAACELDILHAQASAVRAGRQRQALGKRAAP